MTERWWMGYEDHPSDHPSTTTHVPTILPYSTTETNYGLALLLCGRHVNTDFHSVDCTSVLVSSYVHLSTDCTSGAVVLLSPSIYLTKEWMPIIAQIAILLFFTVPPDLRVHLHAAIFVV